MPTKSLEEMRDKLYEAFDKSIARSQRYVDYEVAKPDFNQAVSAAVQAAAQASEAVIKIEREIMMRDIIKDLRAQGADVEVDMEKGLVRSIAPMNKIKLKQPGDA